MSRDLLAAALIAVCAMSAACGKKGPPLTPIVRVPAAVDSITPRRVGDAVYITLTIPKQNIDASSPASIARVELYAATAMTPPPRNRLLEIATLVATVPVAPAADPANPSAPMPPPDPKAGATQGTAVTVRDVLTRASMAPRELREIEPPRRQPTRAGAVVLPPVTALRRFYMAVAFSNRGQSSPYSAVVEMPLTRLPDPPTELRMTMTAAAVGLEWQPAGGLIGWLMDHALAMEAAPFVPGVGASTTAATPAVTSELPSGPTQYNVYRDLAADPLMRPDERTAVGAWTVPAPQPANPSPLATLTFSDPIALDERQRCYVVRSVLGSGVQRVESEPSARECVTPTDIYPPAAPTGLQSIPAEGVINLIWEPNGEEDLGGYIVLRHEPGSDTLQQLTAVPIPETRFSDRTVTAGVRYTYIVRAVDSRIPVPNTSAAAEVSETAR